MNKWSPRFLAIAVAAAIAAPAQAEIAIDVINGSEVSLEGLIQADGNWFHNDVQDLNAATPAGNDGKDSEFEMRRAEVVLKGKGGSFDWTLGYDAKANKYLDANIKWKLGTDYLMFGQYKQPNSLEELSSTRHNDFISKAMATNLFGVARRTGIAYGNDTPNWGYQISAFGRELTRNLAQGAGYGGRFYWAPMNQTGSIFHLGVSALDYDTDFDTQRWRVRPDADFATVRLVDTGNITNTDRIRTIGAEAMWIGGPFKVQSEYLTSRVNRTKATSAGDFTGNSWYVYGLWNLTGETWGYKSGVATTPLPEDPAAGMWQLGLRYDATDLNDVPVRGGEEKNLTLGVNWYWRSNFKFMVNYVKVSSSRYSSTLRREVDDDPSILEARAQFYW
ncbi:OprO/OprP family phosphate-selective porin [Tahibacter amnicola]|uniref:OprO/OprP family phosphate-selective porin n=1 Tax=Tahibacter amnicola TaxID=2976241 RepID=A0ABY6BFV7_9GAMM|nr:OprO/OprP family phosphate-selective porin [Tahibacter amnicola]UXI68913.1 OprO/OprP family phosphate-selective porin [Tahibacter amnicola]